MRNKLPVLVSLILLLASNSLLAQPIERRFVNFSLEDGLSQSTILDIKQDAMGFTWLATADGLNVFNGDKFEVFKKNPSDTNTLSDNFVYAILPFNDGKVWVLTQDRIINEVDARTKIVKHIATINEISEEMYSASQMLLGPNGNVWLSTLEQGIFILNRKGKVIKVINEASGLIKSDYIQHLHIGKKYIWVSTTNGLSRLDKNLEKATHYFEGSNNGYALEFQNKLYISLYDKSMVVETEISNPDKIRDTILKNETVISIVSQKDGTLWLGSQFNGIYEIKNKKVFHYKKTQIDRWSLIDNNIFSLYSDYNDDVWIGTNSGLSIYKKAYNIFYLYRHNDNWNSLSSNKIYDIYEDKQGQIWFINYEGGLDMLTNGKFINLNISNKNGLGNARLRSIHQANNGKYYCGTLENGLFEFNPITLTFKSLESAETKIQFIRKIIDYPDSRLLIAHAGGVSVYNTLTTKFEPPPINKQFEAYDLFLSGNILYVASFAQGFFEIDLISNKFINYKYKNTSNSISSNNVMAIVPIGNDTLALGTYGGGISLFDTKTKRFLNFSESDGLRNNSVYGMLKDKENNLWLSTNVGISKWYADRKTVKNYDLPIQLQSLEFNEDAFLKASDGTFYFGGVNGVNFFKPENIIPNTNTPLVVISGLFVGDKKIDISSFLASGDRLILQPKENYLQFYFNAMRLSVPEKTTYYYRLEGLEPEWRVATDEEYIRYNNLASGDYTFLIKACNEDGFCDEEIQQLNFSIATPFFNTFWFYGLLLLAFLSTVFWVYRFRTNNLRKEYIAKMTNVELRALRIQMNPHFIFNSLNSIQYYVLNADSKTAYKYLTKFSSLMRRTLQHSKENFLPLKEELESLNIYLELENMRLENTLDIQINCSNDIDTERTLVPTLFMQPFVENAIIHGLLPKEGPKKIEIRIENTSKGIKCVIEDNGIGRNASRELNKKRNRSHQSTALTAIENRISILNASANINIKMDIEDLYDGNNAVGTRVILEIAK